MRRWTVFFALLASCKRPATRPEPAPAAAAVVTPSASAPAPAPGPRFELVALRADAKRAPDLRLDDLGSHVVLTSRVPVAWAAGDGPLVGEPRLARGLTSRDDLPDPESRRVVSIAGTLPDTVFAVYGTFPEARAMTYDLPLHQWSAEGWKRAVPPSPKDALTTALWPLGERSVVVVFYPTFDDTMPAGWDPVSVQYTVRTSGASKPLVVNDKVGDGAVVATRDGHLFRLGPKTLGVHLVHQREDGKSTSHVLPGTERCSTKRMAELHEVPNELHVSTEGGHAFVYVGSSNEACPTLKAGLYEERANGLVRYPEVREPESPPLLVGVSPDGTPWLFDGSTLHRGSAAHAMPAIRAGANGFELEPQPKTETERCSANRVLAKARPGGEDVWVLAACLVSRQHVDAVFRWAKPQPPVVVAP